MTHTCARCGGGDETVCACQTRIAPPGALDALVASAKNPTKAYTATVTKPPGTAPERDAMIQKRSKTGIPESEAANDPDLDHAPGPVEEFRIVMKGFDVYLEQSPNPGELKNHITWALKLNAKIHRLAAMEDAAKVADAAKQGGKDNPVVDAGDCWEWKYNRDVGDAIRALAKGKP